MIVEIIATCVEDAIRIEQGGADRIELVSGLAEGGVTPSGGLIRAVCRSVSIPVMVMIRPHALSFCYDEQDLQIMAEDIRSAREHGATGVVFGCLTPAKQLDLKALQKLVQVADRLEITFHRAIDDTPDPVEAISILKNYPITRVLTSGGPGKAIDNLAVIAQMMTAAEDKLKILVGSGMNPQNAARTIRVTGAREVHFGTAARINCAINELVDIEYVREIVQNCQV